ncbi:MAG: hypothetical protein KJ630_06110 [Proteobacteria bacterium]|nr:hypothetical protein [Pseudomonadota bacterium]
MTPYLAVRPMQDRACAYQVIVLEQLPPDLPQYADDSTEINIPIDLTCKPKRTELFNFLVKKSASLPSSKPVTFSGDPM